MTPTRKSVPGAGSEAERRQPEFDATEVRDISVAVYKDRLGAEDLARMLHHDGDNGEKLRSRAGSYDPLTRAYLRILKARSASSHDLRQEGRE